MLIKKRRVRLEIEKISARFTMQALSEGVDSNHIDPVENHAPETTQQALQKLIGNKLSIFKESEK